FSYWLSAACRPGLCAFCYVAFHEENTEKPPGLDNKSDWLTLSEEEETASWELRMLN
ncbi:hypothetical protein lerEdw1_019276, partial [Lerista edwardsae]